MFLPPQGRTLATRLLHGPFLWVMGNAAVPEVYFLLATTSRPARFCRSESLGSGSQNVHKWIRTQDALFRGRWEHFWAYGSEHCVPAEPVKTLGAFGCAFLMQKLLCHVDSVLSRGFYSGFKNIQNPLEVKAGTLFICFSSSVMSLTGAL